MNTHSRAKRAHRSTQTAGGITVLVLVLLISFGIMLAAITALIAREAHQIAQQKEIERAFNVTEAGLHYTVWCLNEQNDCTSLQALADNTDSELDRLNAAGRIDDTQGDEVGTFTVAVQSVQGTDGTIRVRGAVPNLPICQTIDASLQLEGTRFAIIDWRHLPTTNCNNEYTLFVTSDSYAGNLGGLSGADDACRTVAGTASLAKANEYVALLSDDNTNAKDREAIDGVVYNTGGDVVAASQSHLWDGEIDNFVLDQNGTYDTGFVWTGTDYFGNSLSEGGNHCANWRNSTGSGGNSAIVGSSSGTGGQWMQINEGACNTPRSLYCLGPR